MSLSVENELIHLLSPELAWRYKILPEQLELNRLTLLIDSDKYSDQITNELEVVTGFEIFLIKTDPAKILQGLNTYYRKNEPEHNLKKDTLNSDDFLQKIISEAKALKSSDIHIEAYLNKCRIRFRIDGKLIERYRIPKEQYAASINKIKIKAGLDIAEKRLPQDGRILISDLNNRTDIRVSVLPTLHGEKIVLRLLNNDASNIHLSSLGLDDIQLNTFERILKKPHGIILISGPTGSGKTTTLYATLKLLNKEFSNILTVEDPIEYTLDGVNQVQLKESIGLTFSKALKTFLRQDPDVIMLGEIRDAETAQMAIRAALTGHLVLSTIHTNSAWGIISRLIDMGIPSFLLASTINMTAAQRLVRKLCTMCKKEDGLNIEKYPELKDLGSKIERHFYGDGCEHCFYTGYSGREAIYEIIEIDKQLSLAIKENQLDIDDYIHQKKILTLKERAICLVNEGTTSMEEVYPILLNH